MAGLTPFQTVGPYLSLGIKAGLDEPAQGDAIVIKGRLLDGAGQPIVDGVLEWWHPSLPAVLRTLTANNGEFRLQAAKPPSRDVAGQVEAPHFAVRVLARGILTQYVTRVYFADDPATAQDHVLNLVPAARRRTLIAERDSANDYRFDVIVQGDNETVFFET